LILMLPNGTVSNTPANAICAEECWAARERLGPRRLS
jgi:hypothetical protein